MKNIFFDKIKNNSRGATLIELLVAVIIFSVVMTAVIGILISAIKANKRIIAKQENIDSARYTMEFMIKELRMAKEDTIDSTLTFIDSDGNTLRDGVFDTLTFNIIDPANANAFISVTYSLFVAGGRGEIRRNNQPISANNINVTALNFFINNWNLTTGSGTAPMITIFMEMKGTTGAAQNETVNLQSAVAPRIYQ